MRDQNMATWESFQRDIDTLSMDTMSIGSSHPRKDSLAFSEDGTGPPSTPATSTYSSDSEAEPKRYPETADLASKARQSHKTVIHEEVEQPTNGPDPPDFRTLEVQDDKGQEVAVAVTPAHEVDSPTLPQETGFLSPPKRVLQPVEYDLPYTHPTMPWDKFYSSRADYPRSMFDAFLNYHRGPLDVLHDLGAGSGLAADGLLSALAARQRDNNHNHRKTNNKFLPRTILSDPGEENLAITARFVTARQPGVQLECWQGRGEDQDDFLIPSGVDMTLCTEALHWMDMPDAIVQTAHSLRPGGTFAVVLYSCFPRILNNGRVKKCLRTLVEDHLRRRLLAAPGRSKDDAADDDSSSSTETGSDGSPDSPTSVKIHPNWERGMKCLAYGLDAVDLPADQWDDIKRYEINCGATGWWWPSASKDMLGCDVPMADSSPHERFVYEDYEDWGRWASLRELKELLLSIQVGFGEKTWEGPLWKELEASVKGPLHLVWQVHMIMARKKSPGLETVPEES